MMMQAINPKLLSRLEQKLGVGKSHIYTRIARIASRGVERNVAALILAAETGIGITRFSTPEERAAMRGFAQQPLHPVGPDSGARAPAQAHSARGVSPAKRQQTKKMLIEPNSVFVVHGRDVALTESMFDFLRSVGLQPLEFEQAILLAKDNNPHLQEILDAAMAKVQAVVVILSPDDLAMLRTELHRKGEPNNETKLRGQPRQNVIFEAGLAMGSNRDKTILVQVGNLKGFSDIFGRHIPRLSNTSETRNDLINRLEHVGCKVIRQGTHWMRVGNFTPKK